MAVAVAAAEECDHFSFDDSDRFEEDSICTWSSEPESMCNNWRGWKKPNGNGQATTAPANGNGASSSSFMGISLGTSVAIAGPSVSSSGYLGGNNGGGGHSGSGAFGSSMERKSDAADGE